MHEILLCQRGSFRANKRVVVVNVVAPKMVTMREKVFERRKIWSDLM